VLCGGCCQELLWLELRLTAESIQPYVDRVIDQLTEFRHNGMKFIVLERHQAPVVSLLTYADVGGANEPEGKTGGSLSGAFGV